MTAAVHTKRILVVGGAGYIGSRMDLCQSHLLVLDRLAAGGDRNASNLANSNGSSVQQVIDAARRVTGQHIEVKESPRRPGNPARLVANSERARSLRGRQPQYADPDVMVGPAWKWELKGCSSGIDRSGGSFPRKRDDVVRDLDLGSVSL